MDTDFASADRASPHDLADQVGRLAEEPVVRVLLEAVGGHLVVLNAQRQVVAANPEFLTLVGIDRLDPARGERLGELLKCTHSAENPGGCGTSVHCAACGAVLAILEVQQTQQASEHECHLCFDTPSGHETAEFRVKATPLVLDGSSFVVVVFQDISSEKRRQVLEQVFFHDVKNLLAGLSGYGQLMAMKSSDRAAETIVRLSRLLNSEVEAQALLARAESGEPTVLWELVDVASVVQDVSEVVSEYACAKGREFIVALRGPTRVATDRNALVRVLVNMVKNAFEASQPGDRIVLEVETAPGRLRFSVNNPGVMAPDVALRVFERSFSTKTGVGRGVGTYAMRLLAERCLDGRVWFESGVPEGTTFFLDLPWSSSNPDAI